MRWFGLASLLLCGASCERRLTLVADDAGTGRAPPASDAAGSNDAASNEAGVRGQESLHNDRLSFPDCSVADERYYCLIRVEQTIVVVGMETGTRCPVVATKAPFGAGSNSFAWRGEILYTCADGRISRLSLLDGSFETIRQSCTMITNWDAKLLVNPGTQAGLISFPNYAALADGRWDTLFDVHIESDAMTTVGNLVYFGHVPPNAVDAIDLQTGETQRSIALSDSHNAIVGLAMVEPNELVVNAVASTDGDSALIVYDPATGLRKRTFPNQGLTTGLACVRKF